MPEENRAATDQPAGALGLIAQLVPVVAGLLGLTGYVLVLGAAVLWLRLDQAGLPTEVPVSLAARGELIAMGAQALAVWIVLVVVLTVLVADGFGDERATRLRRIVALQLGMTIAGSLLAAEDASRALWALPALAVVVLAIGALLYRPAPASLLRAVIPAACGGVLVWAVWRLAEHQRFITLTSAAVTLVAVLIAVPGVRSRHARRVANEEAVARLEAMPELTDHERRVLLDLRQRTHPESRRSRVTQRLRWVAIAFVALVLLGGVAVASQLDDDENFRAAFVSLDTGRCITGTYLARNETQLVLGAPADEETGRRARAVVIPTARVLEVQVSSPLAHTVPVEQGDCSSDAVIVPGDRSPSLTGTSQTR